MSDELNPIRQALHDARIQRLCEGLQDTRIDWKNLEIERLKQALHDARIENSGQAAELERLTAENTLLLGQRERAMQAALWLRAYKPFAKQFKAAEAELEALEKEVQG
jgi:hypothetical protein